MTSNPRIPHVSIIIPAYNERHRIRPTLEALDGYLRAAQLDHEIIVVDDGSTDGTASLVGELGARLHAIRCLDAGPNRGKGSAVRAGMLAARGEIRVMYDADGAIPATELPKIVTPVRLGEADIAIGSRYMVGSSVDRRPPLFRVLWSRFANLVVRGTLVPGIRDTQCGFKAFSATAARRLFARGRIDGWSFDLEMLTLARALDITVREVPISWSDAPHSRVTPGRDALRVTREMLTIRRNLRHGMYSLDPVS